MIHKFFPWYVNNMVSPYGFRSWFSFAGLGGWIVIVSQACAISAEIKYNNEA